MRKISTLLVMLCAFIGAWAQYYVPGARTTTLEAGKKYFISAATFYGNARPNLLYNNAGNLAYSDTKPAGATISNETYLFTVEEVGEGNVYYIKNNEGKYLQSNTLESTETKTGITVVPYNSVKGTISCGNDVQACDENGNKIDYNAITNETPIVCVYQDENKGWRHISGLQIGKSTPFAFYEALDASEAIAAKKAALNAKIQEAEELLTTAGFSYTGGAFNLQVSDSESAYYLSSNADQNTGGGKNDGAGIAGLIDGKIDDPNYFHTRWSGTDPGEAHYVQVDLGAGNELENIIFDYNVRKAGNANNTSPAPTIIKVYAGNEANAVSNLIATVSSSDAENPLPAYSALGEKWTSNVIEAGAAYRYFRFVVEESAGPGGNKYGNYYFFCMAEFGLAAPLKLNVTNETYKSRAEHLYKLSTAVAEAKVVVEGAEMGAMDACVANLTQKVSNVNTTYPFELTTNDADPVVYALKSGRTNDGLEWWYTYDSSDGKISLTQYTAAQTQLWYFKETLDAEGNCVLQLFPYAGEGKAMSYENTGNGASKVVAKDLNTAGWTNYWLLVAGSNGKYGLQTNDKANYLSNNGGVTNKMGMWNSGPDSDAGTAIYFIDPAEAVNNLVAQAEEMLTNAGTKIGNYTAATITNISAAVNSAKDCLAAKNYAEAVAALNTAIAAAEIILPTPGKVYAIKSASTNAYCAGKYVHANTTSVLRHDTTWGDRVYDHRHLIFDDIVDVDPTALWMFTEDMELKNVHTGEYVKSFNNGVEHMGAEGDAQTITIGALGEAQVYLKIGANYPMHAQEAYGAIVTWAGEKNSASAWYIEEVEEFSHVATITGAGYATLVLGFNAVIPNEVEAYAVTAAGDGVAEMTQVTGVLPANQAVILKGAAKDYEFAYTTETATVEGNLLKGTLFDSNVAAEAYVLGNNGGVGLFKATFNRDDVNNEEDADGDGDATNDFTAFLNNANKAYLLAADVTNTPQGALRFNFGGTTAIESVVTGLDTNAAIYDLSGRRVEKAVKGIYIQNGKKIIVK